MDDSVTLWLATSQEGVCVGTREELDQPGDHAGPASLMRRPDPCAVVSVEVLVEQDVVPPGRVLLEERCPTEHRAPPVRVPSERRRQAVAQLFGHLIEVHLVAGSGWAFDAEAVAVVEVELQQG